MKKGIYKPVILRSEATKNLLFRSFASLRMTAVIFAIIIALPALAQDPDILAKAEIDKAFITIGDPVIYTLTVTHAPDIQILSGFVAPSTDVLKIKKVEDINKKLDSEKILVGRRFTLTSYKLGEYILEPIKIEFRQMDGTVGSIETNRLFLTVRSVAEGQQKFDIRGIKSVLGIQSEWAWLFWILILLILAGGGVWAYERFFKRKPEEVPQGPPQSLEQQTLERLHKLFDSDLLRREKYKEYYLTLSEILRAYFEKRYQIAAIESTTYEILRYLRQQDIDRALLERISAVLESADLAKFAKWRPEPSRILDLNKQAVKIVEESTPREIASGV